jgi:hypothetical protein
LIWLVEIVSATSPAGMLGGVVSLLGGFPVAALACGAKPKEPIKRRRVSGRHCSCVRGTRGTKIFTQVSIRIDKSNDQRDVVLEIVEQYEEAKIIPVSETRILSCRVPY